jgi:hypothetical protein
MIELITLNAWHCTECDWKWFDRKNGEKPKRCPRRKCRALAGNKISAFRNAELTRVYQTFPDVLPSLGKTCAHGFQTCNSCGFKDGAKIKH